MKNTSARILAFLLVAVMLVCALASCGNISESYAEKINEAAKAGEHYTYEKVVKDLGDDAVELAYHESGVVIAVKGCSSIDDISKKIDDGETVKGIVVTMVAGKATYAVYKEITKDDLK